MATSDSLTHISRPNDRSRRGVRSVFICPGCHYQLQAVLVDENTTVRCECETEFVVQLPPLKAKGKSKMQLSPSSNSLANRSSRSNPNGSDSDSYASLPSLSSVQSMQASACSSASSVMVTAPSVVSVDSFSLSEPYSMHAGDAFGATEESISEAGEAELGGQVTAEHAHTADDADADAHEDDPEEATGFSTFINALGFGRSSHTRSAG